MADGITSLARISGLVTTMNAPSSPNAAIPATPTLGLRRAMQPSTMAISPIATYMPSSSTVRSCVPKCAITECFSVAGIRSMKMLPTTLAGEACGRTNAAANVATPIATAAARMPITAPTTSPRPRFRSVPASGRRHHSPSVSGATSTEEVPGSSAGYSSCSW